MKFLNWLKKIYTMSSCDDLKSQELDMARRDLLVAETALDYAESMVTYNKRRISRLSDKYRI